VSLVQEEAYLLQGDAEQREPVQVLAAALRLLRVALSHVFAEGPSQEVQDMTRSTPPAPSALWNARKVSSSFSSYKRFCKRCERLFVTKQRRARICVWCNEQRRMKRQMKKNRREKHG
jgi:molybdenum cofactor biosynthesis enzyme MoaA